MTMYFSHSTIFLLFCSFSLILKDVVACPPCILGACPDDYGKCSKDGCCTGNGGGGVGDETTTEASTNSGASADCKDLGKNCWLFKQNGRCKSQGGMLLTMYIFCRSTCQLCAAKFVRG